MNYQVDVIIIGDSKSGHEILDKIAASKPTIKIAFISDSFKSSTTRDYLNVEYFKSEVLLVDYKNRLFGCYLKNNSRIYSTHLVVATGLSYSPLMLNGKAITTDVFNNTDDISKQAKNQPAIVICNKNTEVKFALEVAKKYKQVYLCTEGITIKNLSEANAKKLNKTSNIVVLPNTAINRVVVKNNILQKVELNNYSILNCSAIYVKTEATPAANFIPDNLIQKNDKGYLVTAENAESTIIPKCFAAGNCAQKYTKTSEQLLIETILKDF